MTKIKICGLFRPCDVDYVNEARPDWCGFIVNFPKSHRNRTPDQVRTLRARLDPAVIPVGVFVDRPVGEVAGLLNDGTITVAQLHGHEDEDYLAALRASEKMPGCARIYTPGEKAFEAMARRLREGVPVEENTLAEVRQIAGELGVEGI